MRHWVAAQGTGNVGHVRRSIARVFELQGWRRDNGQLVLGAGMTYAQMGQPGLDQVKGRPAPIVGERSWPGGVLQRLLPLAPVPGHVGGHGRLQIVARPEGVLYHHPPYVVDARERELVEPLAEVIWWPPPRVAGGRHEGTRAR